MECPRDRSCIVAVDHVDELEGVAAGVVRAAGASECPWVIFDDDDGC